MPHTPNTKKLSAKTPRTLVDVLVYFFSIATPLFELPQAYTIYINHSAQNVSIFTWGFFLIDNFIWIVYAVRKNSKPLLITSILYLCIEALVVFEIFFYS